MADLIQKAVEWDKLSAKFKKEWGSIANLDHRRWRYQPKYDGCHVIFDTRDMVVFSRTREIVRSMDHILEQLPRGYVIQGEAYQYGTKFPEISGAFRRHSPQPQLILMAYDIHEPDAFCAGRNDTPYADRSLALGELIAPSTSVYYVDTYNICHGTDPLELANSLASSGRDAYDGLILRDMQSTWTTGPAREGQIIKVKPNVSLDLRVVGWSSAPGAKTGREVVTFTVEYRGVRTDVGSGVPHSITPDNAQLYVGAIVEVECMAVNPNNTLREPRFKGVRFDKLEPDT